MSTPDLHARASALFLEVRALPAGERTAALAAKAADAELVAEVEFSARRTCGSRAALRIARGDDPLSQRDTP